MRRSELEKESVDWTELIEKTVDFAQYAGKIFKDGDFETKKLIFRSLGSNWVLKDGKLSADLHSWFLPFKNFQKFNSSPFAKVRTNRKRHQLAEN